MTPTPITDIRGRGLVCLTDGERFALVSYHAERHASALQRMARDPGDQRHHDKAAEAWRRALEINAGNMLPETIADIFLRAQSRESIQALHRRASRKRSREKDHAMREMGARFRRLIHAATP